MKLPAWWPAVGYGLALIAVFWGWHEGKRAGQLDALLREARAAERPLVDTIRVRDSAFVHDTVRLTLVRHRTDSLVRVDTFVRADTVRLWLSTERAACDTVVSACEARVAARDSLNANLRRQIQLLEHRPGEPGCALGVGGLATVGGHVYAGLGGVCGIKFRLPL